MEYSQAIEFLYGLRLFGTKLGLENTFALARLCDNPHERLGFIHAAGTNGKGSVCAILESIYRHAGLRTGLFTSPHLVSFTERIQVNRLSIAEQDVARLVGQLVAGLGGRDMDTWLIRPTFFEFVTIMALLYFVEQRCDLVIWETGLGGRLDSTNIVTPLASVITNVQYDHQQWLGNTLAEIAGEKAGIIKPGVPVITGTEPGEALDVIRRTAADLHSPLTVARLEAYEDRLSRFSLSLLGQHQQANAAVVLATVDTLQPTTPVSDADLSHGLANTTWPGRFQLIRLGTTRVLLDGAHNPDGARTLVGALDHYFPGERITLVLGLFKDKEWQRICQILLPKATEVFLVPILSERSADPADVQAYSHSLWPNLKINATASVAAALEKALSRSFVVVAGSLHLIGEVMEHLHIAPSARSERELNEWNAARST